MADDTTRYGTSFDADLVLKDAYLVAASAAATVDGTAKLYDVGQGNFMGVLNIDVTAVEIASNDEKYVIVVQGNARAASSTRDAPVAASASTWQNLATLDFGATEVRNGGAIDSTTGRYQLFFRNVQNDVAYPILRLYTVVSGSIATGINYSADIGKVPY